MLTQITKTHQSTCNLTSMKGLKCTKSYRSLSTSDLTLTLLVNDWGLRQPHPYQHSGLYLQGMWSKSSTNKIRNILNLATMLLKMVSFIASLGLPLLLLFIFIFRWLHWSPTPCVEMSSASKWTILNLEDLRVVCLRSSIFVLFFFPPYIYWVKHHHCQCTVVL